MFPYFRMLSAALAASMMLSTGLPPAAAVAAERLPDTPAPLADTPVTNSARARLSASVQLDFEQTLKEVARRRVEVELCKGGDSLGTVSLVAETTGTLSGTAIHYTVTHNDPQNPTLLNVLFEGLELANGYSLRFSGTGYKPCEVTGISLTEASQHVTVATSTDAFTLGDVNNDGEIDETDRAIVSRELGTVSPEYDLNGDGIVDIIDLAYVNYCIDTNGDAEQIPLELLTPVSVEELKAETANSGLTIQVETEHGLEPGAPKDIVEMLEGGDPVVLSSSDPSEISVTIPLAKAIELEQLQIVSPANDGTVKTGVVTVLYEDDTTEDFRFEDYREKFGVEAADINGDEHRTVVINLGKRIPVKKITITVIKTEENQYATIESIKFLQDIVPENPTPANVQVKNLTATPGHESIALKWGALPNVTGYKVTCARTDGTGTPMTQEVSTPAAKFTGLKNNISYTLTVTPINGDWKGVAEKCEATPVPNTAPAKVNMVTVVPGDTYLNVSWKSGEHATSYAVYYTDQQGAATSAYTLAASGLTGTSTRINGLQNGTVYYIYVTASNELGTSPPSAIVEGTPKAVTYERPAALPADEALLEREKIKSIRLLDSGNVASGYNPAFTPEYIIDRDYHTHWTVQNWGRNEHVEVVFTEPVSLSAAFWVPRMDGDYPRNLRAYSIRVWTEGGDEKGTLIVPDPLLGGRDEGGTGSDVHTWPNVRGNPSQLGFGIMPFGPIENITKIQVAGEQRDYTILSLCELFFLKYDPETDAPGKLAALFEDKACTQLKEGVTEEQVAEIEALLNANENYYLYPAALRDEIALARRLLSGQATDGVVLEGVNAPRTPAENYKQGGSQLQPLGVTAAAGSQITVYADIPEGGKVNLTATQFNAEANAWQTSLGALENGRNVLSIPTIGSASGNRGGSLYYTYTGPHPEQVRLHVRRAADIPVLELYNWYNMDESTRRKVIEDYLAELDSYLQTSGAATNPQTNIKNVTELSLPSVLLSLPAVSVQNRTADGIYNSVLAWEEVMHICNYTQGIDNTLEKTDIAYRQNIRCMQMFEGAFMYAAGSHIGIGYGSCAGMATGSPVSKLAGNASSNNLYGWGIAHEIGHNMDKLGKAEITNNLYSLMVQTYDGKQNTLRSRLETSGKYADIFSKVAQQYPGASNNVFVQLGLYWQLHLAYDDDAAPMDFYNQFFKAWKAGTHFSASDSYDDKVALTASAVAGKDLTEFFTRWGMTLSESTKAKLKTYSPEPRAIWYLNDQSRRDRIAGKTAAVGTVSATVAVDKEKQKDVVLTITPSDMADGSIQGYEILRNGKSIDFVIPGAANTKNGETTYTDHIGSANHRTYKYLVKMYDTLGNMTAEADAVPAEVRIAYEAVLSADEYESITVEEGTATIILKQETAVSGLKLTAGQTAGEEITVSITSDEVDAKPVMARTVVLNDSNNLAEDKTNAFVTWFQKPGAKAEDTRIWTYDAKTVTITGLPADVTNEKIALISYAGDDIAFHEDAAVGRLLTNYSYKGENGTETIEAGTLVIVGTYRGDPVWNTIRVMGEFTVTKGDSDEDTTVEPRVIAGVVLMFAEVPEVGEVSDISDGIFVFIPNEQEEAALQEISNCKGVNILPSRMKLELYRTNDPNSADGKRMTAETVWISTPGGDELPQIDLRSEAAQ